MTSQHPTIPGVTVVIWRYDRETRRSLRFGDPENYFYVMAVKPVAAPGYLYCSDRDIKPEHDETLAAVILDQAQWLREAGQCD